MWSKYITFCIALLNSGENSSVVNTKLPNSVMYISVFKKNASRDPLVKKTSYWSEKTKEKENVQHICFWDDPFNRDRLLSALKKLPPPKNFYEQPLQIFLSELVANLASWKRHEGRKRYSCKFLELG